MRKSRLHYNQRCEELQKAKLLSAKAEEEFQGTTGSGNKLLEKRRRYQDEAQMKVLDLNPKPWAAFVSVKGLEMYGRGLKNQRGLGSRNSSRFLSATV